MGDTHYVIFGIRN